MSRCDCASSSSSCARADETGTSALDLIVDEPALIGDQRFDALLAAAAEYISARWGSPGPLWSVSIERFLDTAWWGQRPPVGTSLRRRVDAGDWFGSRRPRAD